MYNFRIKTRVSLFSFIIAALTGMPLMADDTEVYLGDADFSVDIKPNIVFIIDTSGSMDTDVTVTTGTYDSATTYSGDCDADRIYWSSNGTPPSCSTSRYFAAASLVCEDSVASLSNTGSGVYVGRLARYRQYRKGDYWTTLNRDDHDDIVECKVDWGVHGDGGSDKYPANERNGGPFRSNTTGDINWNRTGGSYTLYSANYLNWLNSPGVSVTKTRLEIVQEVFSDLVDSTSGVNAAVMRFDNKSREANKGGYFVLPMQAINDSTRAGFKTAVNAMTPDGYTPLAETMYEAARYYRGEGVVFGDDTDPGTNHAGVLDPDNTSKYKTPIEYQCQQNSIVMLTDGDPTYDSNADVNILALPDFVTTAGTCGFSADDCLDEVAHYLHEYDQLAMDDNQTVRTYTIGFNTDQTLLRNAARKGGGSYHTADDTAQLTTAFTKILTEILAVNTTFVAPAVPVNAFNRLTHRNELYFALFRPTENPKWAGNLKRYELAGDPPVITDANGVPAVDDATGFFSSKATSIWTAAIDAPDGSDVALGGAASRLTVGRTIYTYTGAAAPGNAALTDAENLFNESNALITKEMLGDAGMTDAYRTELLQWARGVDVDDVDEDGAIDDARRQMGDPLHSNPVVINYGGTDASPDISLFVATNEGYIHAIDSRTGAEQFSFIPQELLPNLKLTFENSSAVNHPYGMDGPLTVWTNDVNNNAVIFTPGGTLETGEHAYLYAGMRRGGNRYYALDVTYRNNPKLKWILEGGTGDYAELAQTWSRPLLGRIKRSGATKTVLFFGGGYDVNQDTEAAGVDGEGRAIYMADAATGARLWWAGGAASGANLALLDMKYSMPATVMQADLDADGLTDVMFATDVGGQLWRFDVDNSGSDSTITGGVVAKLADTGAGEHRRFYVKPDVSLLKRKNGQLVFAVGIGSGYRAHPLSTVTQDRYHMLFIDDVYTTPASYPVLTETDLVDVTNNLNPDLTGAKGWYIDLEAGEKVMARSKTVDGLTLFTTYKPTTGNANSCAPSQGLGRLYALNAYDARPLHNLDGVGSLGSLTKDDRSLTLVRGGIQPEPTLIFTKDDHPIIVVGTEKVADIPLHLPLTRTSWEDM